MPYPRIPEHESWDEVAEQFWPPPLQQGQVDAHAVNGQHIMEVARLFYDTIPQCPERTLAFRRLQEALMYANQAVAIHGVTGRPQSG